MTDKRTLVIYDTDPGIDDAMALLYLNALPHVELSGITTTAGNASIADCTRNALHLCERFGINAPVYAGSGPDLAGNLPAMYPDFVHGKNGLGDIRFEDPSISPMQESAAQFIVETVNANPGEVTLLAVGRLTNIAMAFEMDPTAALRVKEIILMGGAYQVPGNVSEYAEANMAGDPLAAAFVFAQNIPITLVGLDVTMQTIMLPEYIEEICASSGAAGEFIREIAPVYEDYYKQSGWQGFPVHDSSAVAFLDQRSLFKTVRGHLDCITQGEKRGQTLLRPSDQGPHQACVTVDSTLMLARYKDALRSYSFT